MITFKAKKQDKCVKCGSHNTTSIRDMNRVYHRCFDCDWCWQISFTPRKSGPMHEVRIPLSEVMK